MLEIDCIKVSVVIPIYNVELYIERCVRSLMEQTLINVEFIFVNDCTPDGSIDILRSVLAEYPIRKKQVRIVNHDENKGSAAVRNTGLEYASGQYIIYCDSDDWVEKDIYEKLLRKAIETSADIVGCDFYDDYVDNSIIRKQLFPQDSKECVKRMLRGELHCSTWNKLVCRDLYKRHKISFTEGVNMWEDVSVMIPLCYHANKIAYVSEPLYHYIHYNTSSYTYSVSRTSLKNLIVSINILESFFDTQQSMAIFEKDLCYMKLTVKLNLLLGSRGELQKKWNRLYPSANRYIISYSCMSWYWRIALWVASCHFLYGFNMMSYVGKRIKR